MAPLYRYSGLFSWVPTTLVRRGTPRPANMCAFSRRRHEVRKPHRTAGKPLAGGNVKKGKLIALAHTPNLSKPMSQLASTGLKRLSRDGLDWDMVILLCRDLATELSLRMDHSFLLDKLILASYTGTNLDENMAKPPVLWWPQIGQAREMRTGFNRFFW